MIRVWDLAADVVVKSMRELPEQEDNVTALCVSAGGGLLAVGFRDRGVSLWDLSDEGTEHPRLSVPVGSPVRFIALDGTSRFLAAGAVGGTARLWDLHDGNVERSMQVLAEHRPEEVSLAFPLQAVPVEFDPRGRFIVTGSYGGVPRLWDLQAQDVTSSSVLLEGHQSSVTAVAFDPQARYLVTGSLDGTIHVWPLHDTELLRLARRLVGRELTPRERARYVTGATGSTGS